MSSCPDPFRNRMDFMKRQINNLQIYDAVSAR
jgi:hypothetical protein